MCRTCGSLISLSYDDTAGVHVPGLGVVQTIEHTSSSKNNSSHPEAVAHVPLGPHGEYCRVCRHAAKAQRVHAPHQRVQVPPSHVLRRAGDLDVIAVPYVLKYLVAELAAMGLRMSFAIAP